MWFVGNEYEVFACESDEIQAQNIARGLNAEFHYTNPSDVCLAYFLSMDLILSGQYEKEEVMYRDSILFAQAI